MYQNDFIGRGMLSVLITTGVIFSGITFFMLDDSLPNIFAENELKTFPTSVCENGLCFIENSVGTSNNILVQQNADVSNSNQVYKNEDFTDIKFQKNIPAKELEISGNKLIMYAEKDSFIREGVQNSNEGSNQVLRVMGSGPINNRALISFNLDELQDVSSGKSIESAIIKMYVEKNNRQWGDGQLISIHSLKEQWNEGNEVNTPVSNLIKSNGVTWRCPINNNSCDDKWDGGVFNSKPTDSIWISNQVDGYWLKFDVTSDILNYQVTKENYGWILMKENEDIEGQINFASREAKSNNPELVVVFSDE